MKAMILVLFTFFSGLAFANVEGRWVGSGYWMFGEDGVGCDSMIIAFEQTPTELKRGKGKFICDAVILHSDPLTWAVQPDGTLRLGEMDAGHLHSTGFYSIEPYGDEGTMVHTTFEVNGNSGTYEERWIGKDGSEIYLIHADFRRD